MAQKKSVVADKSKAPNNQASPRKGMPFKNGMNSVDLYLMSKQQHIFQLSPAEQTERLRGRIAEVQAENLAAGLYNIFQDQQSDEQLILKYSDHTEVVKVDKATGHTRVLKRSLR